MLVKPSTAILDNLRLNTLATLGLCLDSKSPEHSATSINWTYDIIRFIEWFPELSEFSIDFEIAMKMGSRQWQPNTTAVPLRLNKLRYLSPLS